MVNRTLEVRLAISLLNTLLIIEASGCYRAAYMQGGLSYGKRVRPSVRHTREL